MSTFVFPRTREKLLKKRIASLVDLSSGMAQAVAILSAKTRTEGEARILESEIRMDKGHCGDSESIAGREEKLSKLQQRADSLTADIMKLAEDTADRISESHKTAEKEPSDYFRSNGSLPVNLKFHLHNPLSR